jgi:hypothetical protein
VAPLAQAVVSELIGESRVAKRTVSAKGRIATLGQCGASGKIDVAGAIMRNLYRYIGVTQYVGSGSAQYCTVYIGKAGCCTGICSGA